MLRMLCIVRTNWVHIEAHIGFRQAGGGIMKNS